MKPPANGKTYTVQDLLDSAAQNRFEQECKQLTPPQLWQQALAAGRLAAQKKVQELQASKAHAFAVVERANPLDDASPVVAVHGRMWDACGFAWINIRRCNRHPAKGFVDHLKAIKIGYRDDYYGGYTIWGSQFYGGQEITPKEAGCRAAKGVLEAAGIECYVGSRLD